MASQIQTLMEHIDKMVAPWIEKILSLDMFVNGNNGEKGAKTRMALVENNMESMQKDIEEIKKQLEKIQGGLLWGGIAIVVLQIVLKFV